MTESNQILRAEKNSHDIIEINCARQTNDKKASEGKNSLENFPILVAKMYHVIRYGELTKWSCLSNEVIEYTKGKNRKTKSLLMAKARLLLLLDFFSSV